MAWPSSADLIFPENGLLASEARKLGYKNVVLCYDAKTRPQKVADAIIAWLAGTQQDVARLRKEGGLVLAPARREFFEDKRVDAIIGIGLERRPDSLHYRRSLTQVEARLAAANGTTVLFVFADLLASRDSAQLLGRWRQDVKVLRKAKAPFAIVSGARDWAGLRSRKDLELFLKMLY